MLVPGMSLKPAEAFAVRGHDVQIKVVYDIRLMNLAVGSY
jgi:hypothetical protein